MSLLRAAGALELAAGLCRDISAQFPAATWAQCAMGPLLLAAGDAEGAVAALQVGCQSVLACTPRVLGFGRVWAFFASTACCSVQTLLACGSSGSSWTTAAAQHT